MVISVRLTLISTVIFISVVNEVKAEPPGMYIELQNFRKATRFKRFVDIPELWTKFTHQVTDIVERVVPQPVLNFFGHETQKNDPEAANSDVVSRKASELNYTKERGQLDFFGRDWVKRIGKTIDSIGDKLGIVSTKGLDVNKGFFSGIAANFQEHVRAIYPGTYWCGDGDRASSRRELGYFYLSDNCCREHDNCSDYIAAGQVRNGLENSGLFTRSHCECDKRFYDCLKKADTLVSNQIGFTYFTVLGPQCFKTEHPIVQCEASSWKRCTSYKVDTTKEKYPQWFDNPIY